MSVAIRNCELETKSTNYLYIEYECLDGKKYNVKGFSIVLYFHLIFTTGTSNEQINLCSNSYRELSKGDFIGNDWPNGTKTEKHSCSCSIYPPPSSYLNIFSIHTSLKGTEECEEELIIKQNNRQVLKNCSRKGGDPYLLFNEFIIKNSSQFISIQLTRKFQATIDTGRVWLEFFSKYLT